MVSKLRMGLKHQCKFAIDLIVGWTALAMLRMARLADRSRTANFFALVIRNVGPWLPQHRRGRTNLRAAFPEKSDEEISAILLEVWDNLGRFGAEIAHLDRICVGSPEHEDIRDVMMDSSSLEELWRIQKSASPSIYFAAHFANWELPAVVPPLVGVDSYVLYRRQNNPIVDKAIVTVRANCMGTMIPTGLDAPWRLANALKRGGHVGMLVDQRYGKGVDVTFFGRTCKASPLLAQLARRFECPVRGLRVVRLQNRNMFRGEMTGPIDLPRGSDGKIDVHGATQAITSIVEQWIRNDPGQWLWIHNRWR
jgi:Kdo2-lipid IVA lauroyltransferase/acyltransferase